MKTKSDEVVAFNVAVSRAHIGELQRQLKTAHEQIERLNQRGGYTLEAMIHHAQNTRRDTAEGYAGELRRYAVLDTLEQIQSLIGGHNFAEHSEISTEISTLAGRAARCPVLSLNV